MQDAEKAIPLLQPLHYGDLYQLTENTRVKFHDSGHILGAGLIDFKTMINGKQRKILFSGDLGRPEIPVLKDPDQVYNVDYLILESTYGNRSHSDVDGSAELERVINESMKRGGTLVIPAFSVGRTQTLLYLIRELEEAGKIPVIPVYVDSPMAIEALRIFENHISDFDLQARMKKMQGKEIFQPQKLKLCRSKEESMAINGVQKNAIIISASGMVTGGRITHHLAKRLPNQRHTVLLIGYQAEGTRGRIIEEKRETVKIHGQKVPIKAHVETIDAFSGHADYNEMLAWLMPFNITPRKVFIVHGNEEARIAMAEHIRRVYNWDVVIPAYGDSYILD